MPSTSKKDLYEEFIILTDKERSSPDLSLTDLSISSKINLPNLNNLDKKPI